MSKMIEGAALRIYTYRCRICGRIFTRTRAVPNRNMISICPHGCRDKGGASGVRVYTPISVIYRGTGWSKGSPERDRDD